MSVAGKTAREIQEDLDQHTEEVIARFRSMGAPKLGFPMDHDDVDYEYEAAMDAEALSFEQYADGAP